MYGFFVLIRVCGLYMELRLLDKLGLYFNVLSVKNSGAWCFFKGRFVGELGTS